MIRPYGRGKDDVGGAALSGVDQRIRECLQMLWLALPKDNANLDVLESQFNRLVTRALKDFREDSEQFQQEGSSDSKQEGSLF